MPSDNQHLIFDADDTLWENNVVFEEVIAEFIEWIDHPTLDPQAIRAILDEVERANAVVHGYGTKVFTRSLHEAFARLSGHELRPSERDRIARLVRRLEWEELELIEGVRETLQSLETRHDLLVLTKGDAAEQQLKLDVSGLAQHFRHAAIVHEKDPAAYHELVQATGLDPARTWMIGNSPRSDILPALEAGLRAVWVPHPDTWSLEHEEVPDSPRVVTVEHFSELLEHF